MLSRYHHIPPVHPYYLQDSTYSLAHLEISQSRQLDNEQREQDTGAWSGRKTLSNTNLKF
jgi:hypothetical protein